jgi:hypothetical protein
MTGAEIVAAAKAADALANRALQTDNDEKRRLLELSRDTTAMQAAADSYAKRIAVKQHILLKLYQPLARLVGVPKTYFAGQFARDLAEQVADIPDENLICPPGIVALPAMQALAFSLDEPDLKTMYLKLLAAASDNRRPYDSHPSFAQIIRELSSAEAKLLLDVLRTNTQPIARIKVITGYNAFQPIHHHLLNWPDQGCSTDELVARCAYVDNWIRLGLVDVQYDVRLVQHPDADPYGWVTSRPEYPTTVQQPEPTDYEPQPFPRSVGFDPGILRITDFGQRFLRAIS